VNDIYLITVKRGQGETEIIFISDSYDEMIKNYYESKYYRDYVFKVPLNFFSVENPIKLQKTSKYRLDIKKDEIKSEYLRIIRDQKLSNILE
jgi:hypothetical protein